VEQYLEKAGGSKMITRRELIGGLAGAAAAMAATTGEHRLTICAFSKHYQWATVSETAETVARLGFDGLDLTVRKGGHVEPARVADDLPKAVEIIRKAGLQIPMVTGDIIDTQSPYAENVLKTLASLGIHRYRWGGMKYTDSQSIPEQLAEMKVRVKDLAAMNKHYGVCAMYHTHSGVGQVGASMWDLYLLIKDFDREAVSANYDIGHATVEGGFGGWVHSTRLLLPYMKGVAVKDFLWKQNAKGKWAPAWCALGKGMVDFQQFFQMIKAGGFSGPLQLHMEYPELGGANEGHKEFTIPKDRLIAIMKRDLDLLRGMLRDASYS
jgi:sugar phosphate isomerase/epimerase